MDLRFNGFDKRVSDENSAIYKTIEHNRKTNESNIDLKGDQPL